MPFFIYVLCKSQYSKSKYLSLIRPNYFLNFLISKLQKSIKPHFQTFRITMKIIKPHISQILLEGRQIWLLKSDSVLFVFQKLIVPLKIYLMDKLRFIIFMKKIDHKFTMEAIFLFYIYLKVSQYFKYISTFKGYNWNAFIVASKIYFEKFVLIYLPIYPRPII